MAPKRATRAQQAADLTGGDDGSGSASGGSGSSGGRSGRAAAAAASKPAANNKQQQGTSRRQRRQSEAADHADAADAAGTDANHDRTKQPHARAKQPQKKHAPPPRRGGACGRLARALLAVALAAAALAALARWRAAPDADSRLAAAVDQLNGTLRSKLNVSLPDLPDLPDLDLSDVWRALNDTARRRLNLSLPDVDAVSVSGLVDSLLLSLNAGAALSALGGPFAGAAGGGAAGGGPGGAAGAAGEPRRPGQLAAARGLRARHPVVIVPGFVTSGLELWEGRACAAAYFRRALWAGGSLSMGRSLLADKACWCAWLAVVLMMHA